MAAATGAASPVVFVVDDDQGLSRLITQALERDGLRTAAATSFQAAIEWLERQAPDLMLLDLKLEDIGGKDLVDHLTANGRSVPFIIITGQGDERVAVAMMKRGALDYLVKDGDFLQFVPEVVRRALNQLERDKKLAAAEAALRRSEANLARAQQMAHLGSFELSLPWSDNNYRSEEILRILGLEPAEAAFTHDRYVEQIVHPQDRARFEQTIDRAIREGVPFNVEYRIVRPDGSIRFVQSMGEPVLDLRDRPVQLVGTMLDITERRRLEQEILQISELEQRRIGQDLHDGLCQHLAAVELMSQLLEQKLARKSKSDAARATEIAKQIREAISQTKAIARGLSPVALEAEGLMSALSELAAYTERMFHISCRLECQSSVLIPNYDTATHLYRIAQEAVSNAIRHGRANQVTLSLQTSATHLTLSVRDNGLGLSAAATGGKGMGLGIMRHRATMMSASLSVRPAQEGGTIVLCSVQHEPASTGTNSPNHDKGTEEIKMPSPHRG